MRILILFMLLVVVSGGKKWHSIKRAYRQQMKKVEKTVRKAASQVRELRVSRAIVVEQAGSDANQQVDDKLEKLLVDKGIPDDSLKIANSEKKGDVTNIKDDNKLEKLLVDKGMPNDSLKIDNLSTDKKGDMTIAETVIAPNMDDKTVLLRDLSDGWMWFDVRQKHVADLHIQKDWETTIVPGAVEAFKPPSNEIDGKGKNAVGHTYAVVNVYG